MQVPLLSSLDSINACLLFHNREMHPITSQLHLDNICSEWLQSCIEYVNQQVGQDPDQLLRTQILYSDLSSLVSHSSIAPNKKILVQINNIEEIGISKQTLLDSVNNQKLGLPRQMLKLTLTDGINQFFGVELERINNISLDMNLGAKIIVQGTMRRNVMFLKNNQVEFLGGSVAEFNTVNGRERVESALRNDLGLEPIRKSIETVGFSSTEATAMADTHQKVGIVEIPSDDEYFDDELDITEISNMENKKPEPENIATKSTLTKSKKYSKVIEITSENYEEEAIDWGNFESQFLDNDELDDNLALFESADDF